MSTLNDRDDPSAPALQRYSRQMLFPEVGEKGQQRLRRARATLIGCGALGTVIADTLVRAGVGFLRICDRDYIERDNLQRQILFDEDDISANLPKAEAAARKLRTINRDATVEPVVADVNHTNIERLCQQADVLLDGTDSFETRFLINDLAVRSERPWVYGAVIGATGLCMSIIPHDTPCLRCVFEVAPPPEMNPTCDTAGVIGPAVSVVASFQACEALKLLMGRRDAVHRGLLSVDVWAGRVTSLNVQSTRESGNCPCCKRGDFAYLDGRVGSSGARLCGRNAVQINSRGATAVSLVSLAQKLRTVADGVVRQNEFMVRCKVGEYELTVFGDGRAIVKNTDDVETARAVYARYVGG